MSESGIEMSEADRLEQAQGMDPDPGLVEEMEPELSPVSGDQVVAGMDADPADVAEQGPAGRLAEESHDVGGPGEQQAG